MKNIVKLRPTYLQRPIRTLDALCLALGTPPSRLIDISLRANNLYRKAKPILKSDGSIRQPYDALPELKTIQRRIKDRFLKKTKYPSYLTGSLQGVDYRVNASMHTGAAIVICEDIESFFPNTTYISVEQIWQNFFGFSKEVAEILTRLTTMNRTLPQGAVTSSYLANLVFGNAEANLNQSLSSEDIIYSRYVDDIAVSSKRFLEKSKQSEIIARIYGMLSAHGHRAKRSKHEIFTAGQRMLTTKLVINRKASLPIEKRQNIRTAVFQIECRINGGERSPEVRKELNRVTSQVGLMGSLHKERAAPLKKRLQVLRELLSQEPYISCGDDYKLTSTENAEFTWSKDDAPW